MSKKSLFVRLLHGLNHFFIFFLLVAVVTTLAFVIFVPLMERELGIVLTQDDISTAAKATLIAVIALSAVFTAIDSIRRRVTVERPVRMITEAAERMSQGDLAVRIEHMSHLPDGDGFNRIIDCFNQLAQELSGVETLRTDFVANVSHEMKTPLTVIQNYGRLLQSPDLDEEKRIEYARAVSDASRRLADMMTNILKLNRLESQQIYQSAQEYDLTEQLCECLLGYESVWEAHGIEIETELEEGVVVCADRELLSLVWNNLFSNAFKFTQDGGKVTLTLSADSEMATVKVRDTGCGMSAEVGARIFDKFYQGDSSRATQGNGLGLALVKRVIDITGSDISVESAVGEGSEFTVRIRRYRDGLQKAR